MSPAFKIEKFVPISITKAELRSLGDGNASFLASVCYSINEIMVFQKLLISSFRTQPSEQILLQFHVGQQNTILRSLAAKVYEFLFNIESQKKFWMRGDKFNFEISHFEYQSNKLDELKNSTFYSITKELRDKLSNHYVGRNYVPYLDRVANNAELSFLFHEQAGNCHYTIGEEVVFAGFLNRTAKDVLQKGQFEDERTLIEGWMDWLIQTGEWCMQMANDVIRYFLIDVLQKQGSYERVIFCDPALVGSMGDTKLPILIKNDEQYK